MNQTPNPVNCTTNDLSYSPTTAENDIASMSTSLKRVSPTVAANYTVNDVSCSPTAAPNSANKPIVIDPELRNRALGALFGLAIGDALGMPTQSFSRKQIQELFPNGIQRFEPGPANQPLAPNLPAGTITDDTEQALILADQLIKFQKNHPNSFPNSYLKNRNRQNNPKTLAAAKKHQNFTQNSQNYPLKVLDPESYAQDLLNWHQQKIASGSLDLLGPSTLLALERLQNGDPDPGRDGSTNGAAMRITPVAIAFPPGPALEEAVLQASQLTHNTTPALTAAAAISAMISSLIDEPDFDEALNYYLQTTTNFKNLGNYQAGADIQCRIEWVLQNHFSPDQIYNLVGTSLNSNESIPAVFALLKPVIDTPTPDLALHQLFEAAALGGDTDTISATLGAILGAKFGLGLFPQTMIDPVLAVNNLNLYAQVDHLLQIRAQYIFPKQQPGNPTPDPTTASYSNSTNQNCNTHEACQKTAASTDPDQRTE